VAHLARKELPPAELCSFHGTWLMAASQNAVRHIREVIASAPDRGVTPGRARALTRHASSDGHMLSRGIGVWQLQWSPRQRTALETACFHAVMGTRHPQWRKAGIQLTHTTYGHAFGMMHRQTMTWDVRCSEMMRFHLHGPS
jgi:hypothetical protein